MSPDHKKTRDTEMTQSGVFFHVFLLLGFVFVPQSFVLATKANNPIESIVESVADIAGNPTDEADGNEWRFVKVEKGGKPVDVPEGFEVVEMDPVNFSKYLQYLEASMEKGTAQLAMKTENPSLDNVFGSLGTLFSMKIPEYKLENPTEFDARSPVAGYVTRQTNRTNYDLSLSFPWPRMENVTHVVVDLPDGSKEYIYVWAQPRKDQWSDSQQKVFVYFKGVRYDSQIFTDRGAPIKYSLGRDNTDKLVLYVENNKIVKIQFNNAFDREHFLGCKYSWSGKSNALGLVAYMASIGQMPTLKCPINLDDGWEPWSSKSVDQMKYLVTGGFVKTFGSVYLVGDDVLNAYSLLKATKKAILENVNITSAEWQKVENSLPDVLDGFSIYSSKFDKDTGAILGKISSRAKEVFMKSVEFEDLKKFTVSFEKHLGEKEAVCEEVIFMEIEQEANRMELSKLMEKLGWKDAKMSWDNELTLRFKKEDPDY